MDVINITLLYNFTEINDSKRGRLVIRIIAVILVMHYHQ